MSGENKPSSPASVPLPRRINVKAAFDSYVAARHKLVPPREKIAPAADAATAAADEALPGYAEADSGSAAGVSLRPRAGVGIPKRLVFHRGAGTWRDRLPSGASQHGVDRD